MIGDLGPRIFTGEALLAAFLGEFLRSALSSAWQRWLSPRDVNNGFWNILARHYTTFPCDVLREGGCDNWKNGTMLLVAMSGEVGLHSSMMGEG